MEDRSGALGEIAWDVISRLVRERLARKAGAHLIEGALDRFVLRLPIDLRAVPTAGEFFASDLIAAIDRYLDDAIHHAAAFRPGHAYCHRCRGIPCEHSEPPSHRHVFAGYTPTGLPRWEDFAQLCLDLRHADVDRLYADPPAFVALVRSGAELSGSLLDAFRSETGYELAGQIAAGFFPLRARDGEGRGVLAVSFQIGASHGRTGGTRYGLNVLGKTPQGEALDLLWERHDQVPWLSAVKWAQSALGTLERKRRRDNAGIDERLTGILRGLARRLEHERRASGRRTRHAEAHHVEGRRPTRKAVDDARSAGPDAVLVDERHGTMVVAGERGRMHFYTPEGKLVSSVRYSREAIERKRKLGIWREASASEAAAFASRVNPADALGTTDRSGG